MNAVNKKLLKTHEDVLEAFAEAIDIPDNMAELARDRYESIGAWLDRPESTIKKYNPKVSPQGSFLLGTVIRPIGDWDHYDVDVVCKLDGSKREITMAQLKSDLGVEIKAYAKAKQMNNEPSDARRCWTLDYADGAKFHMDILPALPDEARYRVMLEQRGHTVLASNTDIAKEAIAITDKTHPQYRVLTDDWNVSNPKGYAVWFKSRQATEIRRRKQLLVEREIAYASVDQVPDHDVKTPLQQAIQLLKRHRDTMFDGDYDKPISIIITTLAAHAYGGEMTISGALRSILKSMSMFIEIKNGADWVANPVNPDENFADKWAAEPQKRTNFYMWLDQAQRDFGLYLASPHSDLPKGLRKYLTEATVQKVESRIVLAAPAVQTNVNSGRAEADKISREGRATKPWRK